MNLIRLHNNSVDGLQKLKEYYLKRMSCQIDKLASQNTLSSDKNMSMEMFEKRMCQINNLLGWLEKRTIVDIELCKTDVQELMAEAQEEFPDCVLALRSVMVLLTEKDSEEIIKTAKFDNGLFTSVMPYGLTTKSYLSNVANNVSDALNSYCRDIQNSAEDYEDANKKIAFVKDVGTLVVNALNSKNHRILYDCYLSIKGLFEEIKYAYSDTESDEWFESFDFVTEVFMKESEIDKILVSRLSFTVGELCNAENITDAIEEVAQAITELHDDWRDEEEGDIGCFEEELEDLKLVMKYLLNLI